MFKKINLLSGLGKIDSNFMNIADFILNDTFGNYLSPMRLSQSQGGFLFDGWSDKDAYYMEAQLPGLSEESIDISISGQELSIKASMNEDLSTNRSFIIKERPTGKLEKVFTLDNAIDSEKIEATYHSGILKIKLPKAENNGARKIIVKTD